MTRAGGKVVKTPRSEAHLYLSKASEFAAQARAASDSELHDAAVLLSVHAAISSADAVTVTLAGLRSADPDHQRGVDLLGDVARGSEEIQQRAAQLRALLQKKNLVEYESRRSSPAEARDAVARAERLVAWARSTVVKAKV